MSKILHWTTDTVTVSSRILTSVSLQKGVGQKEVTHMKYVEKYVKIIRFCILQRPVQLQKHWRFHEMRFACAATWWTPEELRLAGTPRSITISESSTNVLILLPVLHLFYHYLLLLEFVCHTQLPPCKTNNEFKTFLQEIS